MGAPPARRMRTDHGHTREHRIQDLYLAQRDAELLKEELQVLAEQEWREFRKGQQRKWKHEDEDDLLMSSSGCVDPADPIAAGWVEREEHARASTKAEQRKRVLADKWEELQQRVQKAHEEWKSAAEIQAWNGMRKRRAGEDESCRRGRSTSTAHDEQVKI